jgi:hypothetical protein
MTSSDILCSILIEADPHNSLGGSCSRDVKNVATSISNLKDHKFSNTFIISTRDTKLKEEYPKSIRPVFLKSIHFRSEIQAIVKLCQRKHRSCKFFVYISGHGYQTRDNSGDEMSGMDDYIVMNDGIVLDDYIYDDMVQTLRGTDTLHALVDTCHSGSMFDLDYRLDYPRNTWKKYTKRPPIPRSAYSISACKDSQLAACDIGVRSGYGGALTVHFLDHNLLAVFLTSDFKTVLDVLTPILCKLGQSPECCSSDINWSTAQ